MKAEAVLLRIDAVIGLGFWFVVLGALKSIYE